jgi:hypothetical protein
MVIGLCGEKPQIVIERNFFFSHLNSNQSFAGVEVFGTSYAWV